MRAPLLLSNINLGSKDFPSVPQNNENLFIVLLYLYVLCTYVSVFYSIVF